MRNILILMFLIASNAVIAGDLSINDRCSVLAKNHIEQSKKNNTIDYALIETDEFYSEKVDSCILIERTLVGVEVNIRDLSKSIIIDGGKNFNILLHCDIDGADSVILDNVRSLKGRVFNVSYKEWVDDGYGGAPRALKAPDKPYTKKDCDLILQKWLKLLK